MAPAKSLYLRESERKVQEQSWLQEPSDHVAPVDDLVKLVQLSGVLEGIKDERDQAENIKVHGLRGSPASQKNVKADRQVDKRDKPQAIVERLVRSLGDERSIQSDAVARDRVN